MLIQYVAQVLKLSFSKVTLWAFDLQSIFLQALKDSLKVEEVIFLQESHNQKVVQENYNW